MHAARVGGVLERRERLLVRRDRPRDRAHDHEVVRLGDEELRDLAELGAHLARDVAALKLAHDAVLASAEHRRAELALGAAYDRLVLARLEHVVARADAVHRALAHPRPLVHRAVDARRRHRQVALAPREAAHHSRVALERAEQLGGVRGEDADVRARDGREVLAATREAALLARLDGEVGRLPHVVHQEVEEAQLVGEADEHVVAARVDGDAQRLVGEVLDLLADHRRIVPYPQRLVGRARDQQRLAHAAVDAGDRAVVKAVGAHEGEVFLLGLQDVDVGERERGELRVRRGDEEGLLGRRHRQRRDVEALAAASRDRRLRGGDRRLLDGGRRADEVMRQLVELLLAILGALEDQHRAALSRREEAARERREAQQLADAEGHCGGDDLLELALLDEEELGLVGARDAAVLAREPAMVGVILVLAALVQINIPRLELSVRVPPQLEELRAGCGERIRVSRVDRDAVDAKRGAERVLLQREQAALVPQPERDREIARHCGEHLAVT